MSKTSSRVTNASTPDAAATDAVAAPPFLHPVGTPPGGGAWTWDTNTGEWVSLDTPVSTSQE